LKKPNKYCATRRITEGSEEIQMRRVAQYLFGFFKDRKVAEE